MVAPMIGPTKQPAPPIRTITSTSADWVQFTDSGAMNRLNRELSAPATPAKGAPTTNAASLYRRTLYPSAHMRPSEPRRHDGVKQRRTDRKHSEYEEIERLAASENRCTEQRCARNDHPVGAAGHRLPAERHHEHHLRKRKRDHQEIESRQPDREPTDRHGTNRSHQHCKRERNQDIGTDVDTDNADGIAGDAEKCRMTERDQPGIAEENIQAQRKQREHKNLDNHRLDKLRHAQKRRGSARRDHEPEHAPEAQSDEWLGAPLHDDIGHGHSTSSSSRPQARINSTAAIRPNMMKLAAAGYSALP